MRSHTPLSAERPIQDQPFLANPINLEDLKIAHCLDARNPP